MLLDKIISLIDFGVCKRILSVSCDRFSEIFKIFESIDASKFLFGNQKLHSSSKLFSISRLWLHEVPRKELWTVISFKLNSHRNQEELGPQNFLMASGSTKLATVSHFYVTKPSLPIQW